MIALKKFVLEHNTYELNALLNTSNKKIDMPHQPHFSQFSEFSGWISHQINNFYHDLYLVYEFDDLIGYILAYDYRIYDEHCKITGYIKTGMKAEILSQFVCMLKAEYPLRKIFIETTSYEYGMLESAIEAEFYEEAILKEYRFFDSRLYDMHILSCIIRK